MIDDLLEERKIVKWVKDNTGIFMLVLKLHEPKQTDSVKEFSKSDK
jgi:hypothetical protein